MLPQRWLLGECLSELQSEWMLIIALRWLSPSVSRRNRSFHCIKALISQTTARSNKDNPVMFLQNRYFEEKTN
jgi:hypothetical protein